MAPRFELGMEALQATALPLGYATVTQIGDYTLSISIASTKKTLLLILKDFFGYKAGI